MQELLFSIQYYHTPPLILTTKIYCILKYHLQTCLHLGYVLYSNNSYTQTPLGYILDTDKLYLLRFEVLLVAHTIDGAVYE